MIKSKQQEFSGKTVDKAVRSGLKTMGLSREDADVQVLDSGSRGFLGLFGGHPARVALSPKPGTEPSQVRAMAGEVLRLMGLEDAQISARQNGGAVRLGIDAKNQNGLLIGRGGETLRALEHVLTRMAQRQTPGGRSLRVVVEIGGYRSGEGSPSRHRGQGRKRRPSRRPSP